MMPRLRRGSVRVVESTAWPGGRGRASTPTGCASACASTTPPCSSGSVRTSRRAGGPAPPPRWTRSSRSGCRRAALARGPSAGSTPAGRRRALAKDLGQAFDGARVRDPAERRRRGAGPHLRPRRRRGLARARHPGPGSQPQRQDDARGRAREGGRRCTTRTSSPSSTAAGASTPSRSRSRSATRAAATCHEVVRRRRAEELGGSCGARPLPVGLVVAREHRPGADVAAGQRLTRGTGGARDAGAHGARAPAPGGLARRARARGGAGHGAEGRARRGARGRGPAPAAVRSRKRSGPPASGRERGGRMKPAARRTGLVMRELPGELIVYERDRHRAHCLNRTAASVFRGADGTRSVDDLGALLGDEGDRAEREAAVAEALACSAEARLLEGAPGRRTGCRAGSVRAGGARARPSCCRRSRRSSRRLRPRRPPPASAPARARPTAHPAACYGANPCTATCVSDGTCSDGGCCAIARRGRRRCRGHVPDGAAGRVRRTAEAVGLVPVLPRTRRGCGSPRAGGARRSGRAARPRRGRPG